MNCVGNDNGSTPLTAQRRHDSRILNLINLVRRTFLILSVVEEVWIEKIYGQTGGFEAIRWARAKEGRSAGPELSVPIVVLAWAFGSLGMLYGGFLTTFRNS